MHDSTGSRPRIAIYARYSSSLQKPTSIEDQVRLCEERALAMGATVVCVHVDAEATATTGLAQPGLDQLLRDVNRGEIDIVLAEALDRISRDQEHIHGIHKRLRFRDVRLFTVHDGEIQTIHITLGGYMNSAWIDNLRTKTRRGQVGAARAGRIPGGLSYGYRLANKIDETGQAIRGLREIVPDQADTVRRIYSLYADGRSVRDIVALLNREAVPAPRGRRWAASTINGHRGRRNGILNNELYRGRLVYGRQKFVPDPDTGKRQARPVPSDQWVVEDVPHLRIVDDTLWERVQKRRQAGQDKRTSGSPRRPLPLTGILRCGLCGGPMTIVKPRRYACHAHTEGRTCANPRRVNATTIENDASWLLSRSLAGKHDPSALILAATRQAQARHADLSERIDDLRQRIDRLLQGIETGAHSLAAHKRVIELEREIASREIERDAIPDIPDNATPDLARRLHTRLGTLSKAISRNPVHSHPRRDALLELARLFDAIRIHPLEGKGRYDVRIEPRIDALVALALDPAWSVEQPSEEPAA